MKKEIVETSNINSIWNVSGTRILKYTMELKHNGLNQIKIITAPSIDILNNKKIFKFLNGKRCGERL